MLKLSLKQPVWHVILLTVVSFKLYFIYWCYKNWRDLSRLMSEDNSARASQLSDPASPSSSGAVEDPAAALANNDDLVSKLLPEHLASFKDVSPLLRAFGVAIPYLNAYLFFTLCFGIAKLQPAKSFVAQHPPLCSALVVFAWITLSMLSILPGAYFFLFASCAVPLAFVQHWLNKYLETKEEPALLMRHGFTGGELVVVIAGALWMGYLVSAFIMGTAK